MEKEQYLDVIDKLVEEYDFSIETEHENMHEFYEGNLPSFKLIYAEKGEARDKIVVISFHIDIDIPSAINWYLRVRNLVPHLHITSSYIKDSTGTTHLGEDAELYRQNLIENAVIAALKRNGDLDDSEEDKKPDTVGDKLKEFDKLQPKKGQKYN